MAGRMKFLAVMLCVVFLWGCSVNSVTSDMENPVRFYYKAISERYGEADGAIEFELYDSAGHQTAYDQILSAYFQGPVSESLIAPFPKATVLLSVALKDGAMQINLSEDFGLLSGIDLTVACSCITMTCLELPGVETVIIRANGIKLNGRESISLSKGSLFLEDMGTDVNTTSYTLYFSDTDNRYLIAEETRLDLSDEELPRHLLERLILGPQGAGLAQTIPLNTKVRDLQIIDGVCNVDLSGEFVKNAPKTELAQRMTILSLTNTLTQLDGIDCLVLYVEGKKVENYGAMDIREPLMFDERAIGPARVSLNEMDADLYLYIGENPYLSRVPVRVPQSADKLITEKVLDTLLTYADLNGYHNPIPAGTTVVSAGLEQSVYVIVLSSDFLNEGADDTLLACYSIAATAMAAGEYDAVELRVDGIPATDEFPGLYQIMAWDDFHLSENDN